MHTCGKLFSKDTVTLVGHFLQDLNILAHQLLETVPCHLFCPNSNAQGSAVQSEESYNVAKCCCLVSFVLWGVCKVPFLEFFTFLSTGFNGL